MVRFCLILLGFIFSLEEVNAQEFIPLWPEGKMPNSRGLVLEDSLANDRIYQVGTPGMYAYFPSKEENTGSAVVICPGGGYWRLAHDISGHQLAKWFNSLGISAFVLYYRLPHSPDLLEREKGPLQDAQRAIRQIRLNASEWGIQAGKVGVMGTSAGGHLAASLATHNKDLSAIGDAPDTLPFRPNFMILVSPVISMGFYTHEGSRNNLLGENPSEELIQAYSSELQVDKETPPAFIVHAFNDTVVAPHNSLLFFQELLKHGVPASLHVFPQGGHSIALRNNPGSANTWTQLCEKWLEEMKFIVAK